MSVKKCAICGEMFTTTKRNKKTCSDKCSKELTKERNLSFYMKHREKILESNKQNYVSKKKEVHKTCQYCGKEFTTFSNSRIFCSETCLKESRKLGTRTFVCEFCESEFEAAAKRKFCTVECRRKAESARKKKKKPKKLKHSLAKINELARKEGLTYGQYMAKYGYQER